MSKLTGFQELQNQELENAKKGFNISLGNSPFQHGVRFKVTGFTFTVPLEDGKPKANARTLPVLVTTVGNLYLSLLTKRKVGSDGEIRTPNGTFNKAVADIIKASNGKTDGEILQAIVDANKDKEIETLRTPFVAKSKLQTEYASDLIEFNFV